MAGRKKMPWYFLVDNLFQAQVLTGVAFVVIVIDVIALAQFPQHFWLWVSLMAFVATEISALASLVHLRSDAKNSE